MIKKIIILLVTIVILSGCSKSEGELLPLNFSAVEQISISYLQVDEIQEIIQEIDISDDIKAFLFKAPGNEGIYGGFSLRDKSFNIGEVSMENTPIELMGIKEVEVFGKDAIKFYGILGANYAQAFYWFYEDSPENQVIQVDGNTSEIDIDDDGTKEIIATTGTIPETSIFRLDENKIESANVNQSINAQAVSMINEQRKIFEVYFEPNKTKRYTYYKGSLKEVSK